MTYSMISLFAGVGGIDLGFEETGAFKTIWANEFDAYIKDKIVKREYADVINYRKAGKSSEFAFVTTEHFYPLLYVLGAAKQEDKLTIFNDSCLLGSLSMTCYLFE